MTADAAGNLFGTTYAGGVNGGHGTVFEIAKTGGSYGSATTLVSFTGADGWGPWAPLIIDAAGNIFGTTYQGGPKSSGTVFEIVKTAGGYASSPTTLVDFTVLNGSYPQGGLIADAAGNLFGTTYEGGKHNVGTVFEITHSGFVVAPPAAAFAQAMAGHGPGGSCRHRPGFLRLSIASAVAHLLVPRRLRPPLTIFHPSLLSSWPGS